jgi:serine/threonine protein kinase
MPPTLVGQTLLSQYRMDEFIALTPLGELYRVWDTWRNRHLSMTILPKEIAERTEALKEIEARSSALRKISHPNLIPYYGLFQTPTQAFLLENWVDGPAFREILAQAPLNVSELLVFAKAICSGLEHLHRQGLLHLALAPEMIHVNHNGEILIGGVGLVRPIGEKGFLRPGKYPHHYTAPEQFQNNPMTPATDIYSLSVLLYEAATGKWINGRNPPKSAEIIEETQLNKPPKSPMAINPELPDNFSRMLLWALRKKPSDRLSTTTELLSTLALAVQVSVTEIPARADPVSASATTGILSQWEFLPTPEPNIIAADMAPLEERLALVKPPTPKKSKPRAWLRPWMAALALALIVLLIMQIRPVPTDILSPLQSTPFASDYNHLCIINADGSGLQRLSDIEANDYYPSFSPYGNSLLFASNRNGAFDIYLLTFGEKQLYQITQNIGNVVSPSFSPDARRIAFVNRTEKGPASIWIVNSDGTNPHLIYTGPQDIVAAAWSPDGTKLAYAMSIGIPNEYQIYTMDIDGKNHLQITQKLLGIGGSVNWSPNGRYLLVYAGPVGKKDIFQVDVNTGDTVQLTQGGNNAAASYSPDGQFIVFNSLRNNDQADIYVINADGTHERQLTHDPEPDWGPQWEP